MGGDLRYFLALFRMSVKTSLSLRGAFLLRATFSTINHAIYLTIWVLFFKAVPSIHGWGLHQVLLSYGMALAAWGILSLFAFGLRTLPQQIDHGELDAYLVQPRPVLLNVAMGSPKTSGLGEMLFGIALCVAVSFKMQISLPLVLFFLVCGTMIFMSLVLAYASLGFWLNNFNGAAEEMYFNFNILASRPPAAFSPLMQVVAVTVVPVAFMTHIPISYFTSHAVWILPAVPGMAVLCMGLAYMIFAGGLKRYESGNRFSSHA